MSREDNGELDDEEWQEPVTPLFGGTCWNQSYYHEACGNIIIRAKDTHSQPLLFADDIWPGALFLADFLAEHAQVYCVGKVILELGAGGALPSLVCAKLNCQRMVISDYPDADILTNITDLIVENNLTRDNEVNNIVVIGHIWGESVVKLLQVCETSGNVPPQTVCGSAATQVNSKTNHDRNTITNTNTHCSRYCNCNDATTSNIALNTKHNIRDNCPIQSHHASPAPPHVPQRFDTILLAELLWKDTYSQHHALLSTVVQCIQPTTGRALVCFAHRPVKGEAESDTDNHVLVGGDASKRREEHSAAHDLEFFMMAQKEFGMTVLLLGQKELPDPSSGVSDLVMVYLYELTLPPVTTVTDVADRI